MEPQRVIIHAAKRSIAPEQRAGLIFVVVLGSTACVLGLFFVFKHVSSPFLMTYEGPVFETTVQKQAKEIAAQKTADTDGDGLTDYNELYVYKTSPYLADTDGDGYTDQSEITAGTNPTCPAGADCESTLSNSDATSRGSGTAGFGADLTPPAEVPVVMPTTTSADAIAAFDNLSVAEIRLLLVQSGADQSKVDVLTDDQVQQLYDSALAQVKTGTP